MGGKVDWDEREQQVLAALPGEVEDVQRQTGLPKSAVRSCLNRLIAAGTIRKRTSWISQHAYRWVYYLQKGCPADEEVRLPRVGYHNKKG